MDWSTCVETFIKTAKNNSFSQTAYQLHTTSPSISKRIQWLENYLGMSLLRRTTRSVELTEEGKIFLNKALPLLEQWQNLKEKSVTVKDKIEGTLRIASIPYFGRMFMLPIMQRFQLLHPFIKLEYLESVNDINLIDDQVDVYIGLETFIKSPAATKAVTLHTDFYECYATQKYIKKQGQLTHPKELTKHQCLALYSMKNWELNNKHYHVTPHFSCSNPNILVDGVMHGMGIAYLPNKLISLYTRKNNLRVILPEYRSKDFKISAYYSQQPFFPEKTMRFIEFLRNEKNCNK